MPQKDLDSFLEGVPSDNTNTASSSTNLPSSTSQTTLAEKDVAAAVDIDTILTVPEEEAKRDRSSQDSTNNGSPYKNSGSLGRQSVLSLSWILSSWNNTPPRLRRFATSKTWKFSRYFLRGSQLAISITIFILVILVQKSSFPDVVTDSVLGWLFRFHYITTVFCGLVALLMLNVYFFGRDKGWVRMELGLDVVLTGLWVGCVYLVTGQRPVCEDSLKEVFNGKPGEVADISPECAKLTATEILEFVTLFFFAIALTLDIIAWVLEKRASRKAKKWSNQRMSQLGL